LSKLSTDAGYGLGTGMHGQNLQWRTNMMGPDWDILPGCSGLFVFQQEAIYLEILP
jgi:hypothetical protein